MIDPFLLTQSSSAPPSAASTTDALSSGSPETPTPITGNVGSMDMADSRRRVSAKNPIYGHVDGVMRGGAKFGRLKLALNE